jgi:hypothetical protein
MNPADVFALVGMYVLLALFFYCLGEDTVGR